MYTHTRLLENQNPLNWNSLSIHRICCNPYIRITLLVSRTYFRKKLMSNMFIYGKPTNVRYTNCTWKIHDVWSWFCGNEWRIASIWLFCLAWNRNARIYSSEHWIFNWSAETNNFRQASGLADWLLGKQQSSIWNSHQIDRYRELKAVCVCVCVHSHAHCQLNEIGNNNNCSIKPPHDHLLTTSN